MISQTLRKDSDPFLDSPQQTSKFKQYLEQKVQTIQETKLKTIKMTQKYFTQLKEKMDKYLAKQQKKILNAYEDNINMSINCVNHHFLYDFEIMSLKNGKTQRKLSKQISFAENEQQPRKKSYECQNQLTIKIQVKRLIEQMLLAETHLNQTVKIIGQELKSDMQKIILPLGDLLSKIPKLTQVSENSSTLLVKDFPSTNEKKKGKNSNKSKKIEPFNIKNPQISVQKFVKSIEDLNDPKISSNMTEKLLKKLNFQKQSIHELQQNNGNKLLKLKLISQKQDKIVATINKNSKQKTLIAFDLINGKSLFHVYQKQIVLEFPNQRQENQQRVQQPQLKYQITLNDKPLLEEQNLTQLKYESYCKIQFESKPDREYLALLTSKLSTTQQGENPRKFKNYKITIFNYKGELITKDLVSNLKVSDTENPVKIFQINSCREYIFISFNNRIKRYSLRNLWDQKSKLFSLEDKIIKAEVNEDKIIVFEGRKQTFQLLSRDLMLLQTFEWSALYPNNICLTDLMSIRLNLNNQEGLKHNTNELSLIIPKTSIDAIYYFQNSLIKKLEISFLSETFPAKQKIFRLQCIQGIYDIYEGVFLLLSRRKEWGKAYLDLLILQVEPQEQCRQDSLKGSISYMETINEDIIDSRMLKNHLYLTLKTGKVLAFSLC